MLAKPSIRIILVKKKTPLTKKYLKKNPLELYFIQSKKHVHHTYSSNPVVLKDIHIYMYLFCGRPCRRPVDGGGRQFFSKSMDSEFLNVISFLKPIEIRSFN